MNGGRHSTARRPLRATMPRMKTLLFLVLAGFSLSACAGDGPASTAAADKPAAQAGKDGDAAPKAVANTPAARAREALRSLDPVMPIERVDDAAIPGFQAAIVGGQVIYVSNDGKYLLQGTAYDIAARKDLGEEAMKALRVELMRDIPAKDRIVFAPKDPKYTVSVFTDVDCGYCRKLHGEMADYNAQGIAIEYLAFPRMGPGSENFDEMVAVWCAEDPREALTEAKSGGNVRGTCTSPVAMQYALGQRLGLTGTPMIVAPDGSQLGGYVPPSQLRGMLDDLAAKSAPAPAAAPGATPAEPAGATGASDS